MVKSTKMLGTSKHVKYNIRKDITHSRTEDKIPLNTNAKKHSKSQKL